MFSALPINYRIPKYVRNIYLLLNIPDILWLFVAIAENIPDSCEMVHTMVTSWLGNVFLGESIQANKFFKKWMLNTYHFVIPNEIMYQGNSQQWLLKH